MNDLRSRFPGLGDGWARFDGAAGTQVVDSAIAATEAWQRSGNNANVHGAFPAADACDALVVEARATMGRLLGASAEGMVIGPSTTSNLMGITRAAARDLRPGDEIVCTELDHDANIAPWLLAAADAGASVKMARVDPNTARLASSSVIDLLTNRTRWVAVTGASNAVGVMPDLPAITSAAHSSGALVAVDGVHLTPHQVIDIEAIGCDLYCASAYKWYGPHLAITWVRPELLDRLEAYKVRPADNHGPRQFELGTPLFEALAGLVAAAEFLSEQHSTGLIKREAATFARLLGGLQEIDGVQLVGPHDGADRAPTLGFLVDGQTPAQTAAALAGCEIAVWDGHNYAVELMKALGLGDAGVVRAGVVAYIDDEDVDRLLEAVAKEAMKVR